VSGAVEEFLVEQGVARSKIKRLYCGLDLRDVLATAPLSNEEAKRQLGLSSRRPDSGHRSEPDSTQRQSLSLGRAKCCVIVGSTSTHCWPEKVGRKEELRTQAAALQISDRCISWDFVAMFIRSSRP
jgi:hypothetical protein